MPFKPLLSILPLLLLLSTAHAQSKTTKKQPVLGHRSAQLITADGLQFKDLNKNGKLDKYEDWRLPNEARANDLV